MEKETVLKLFGNVLTITTIVIGIIQYKKTQVYNAKMEFLKMDNKRQVDAYTVLCNSLGKTVAASDDKIEYQKQFKAFMSIYYGDIIMIADSSIENQIKELRFYLEGFNFSDPDRLALKNKIFAIANNCKISIEKKRKELIKEISE